MIPRSLRSPLLALIGASGALALVACSAADTSTVIPRHRTTTASGGTGTGDTTTGGTTGSTTGSTSNGDTSTNTTSGGSSGGAASGGSSGGSSGASGSSSGGGDVVDSGAPAPAAPTFDLLVDNAAPTLKLADTQVVQVTITPTNNWTGDVALSLENLPTDVTATFDNPTVTLGAAATTVKLTLKSVSSTAPVATPFSVVGTAGTTAFKAAVNVTVKSEITISIPVNVDSLKPGFGTINIKAPDFANGEKVVVHFLNLDSTPHEIHGSDSGKGFPHGDGTFGQNQEDPKPRAINQAATIKFYLHDEGAGVNPGQFVIQ